MSPKPGDLLFFSGSGFVSNLIQVATYSLPGRGYSHCGIFGSLHNRPLLYESTSFDRPPCARRGKKIKGVQAHWIEDLPTDTKMWLLPLRRELYAHEVSRLNFTLDMALGRRYDMLGAERSGGFLWRILHSMLREEDVSTLFCSELAAHALVEVGILQTRHKSAWSPNRLARHLLRDGVCDKPIRYTPR